MTKLNHAKACCRLTIWDDGMSRPIMDVNFNQGNNFHGFKSTLLDIIVGLDLQDKKRRAKREEALKIEYKRLYGVDMPVPSVSDR